MLVIKLSGKEKKKIIVVKLMRIAQKSLQL